MRARSHALVLGLSGGLAALLALLLPAAPAPAQSQPAWQASPPPRDDAYRPAPAPRDDAYRPAPPREPYYPPGANPKDLPGEPYPGPYAAQGPYGYPAPQPYSSNEILEAGHSFFGSTTKGLAAAVEFAFQRQGLPNGYILGQDAGGAFVAGIRYGEGILYTKDAGTHRVYWQGPSIGFDLGGDGSKVMVLVYNLRQPGEVFRRFGGVAGAAYLVGGVGLTFQQNDEVIMAPIRTGVGLRLGANIGYLKYTPQPTWDPF